MSQILTPGYLRWDGSKFVLDNDVEVEGPAGSAGPTGNTGPAGPPGPNGTASGDLSGTFPGPISVVGLTGNSGIVNFGISVTNPTIGQTATGATTGQVMTLKAQSAAVLGGNLALQSGTGTTAGLIQFITGSTNAAQIDSGGKFRAGPNAANTFTGFTSVPFPNSTTYISSNNAAGRNVTGTYSGAANDFASTETINYAAGASSTTGIRMFAAGSTYTTSSYQSNGVLDQVGASTSALVFSATSGASGNIGITGRIFQTGAWGIGDSGNNNSSASAQAGMSGAIVNIAGVNGTFTSVNSQATIWNANTGGGLFGNLILQGHVGVSLLSNTTTVANTTTSKFITLQGKRIKVATTTSSPYNVAVNDDVVSIGTITTQATSVAAGSNGNSLPQGTINVVSTTGFATSGAILVVSTNGPQVVTYTSTNSTQFLGCSGGTGTINTGNAVTSLFTVNLPATPTTGDTYTIKDANGSAGANNIAIFGNGTNIDGGVTNIVISTNFTQANFVYNGTTWISSLTNNLSPNAGFSSVVNVVSGGSALVVGQDELLLCDPTSASCTITAPASPITNMRFTVKDATAKSSINPIIVNGNGRTLENPILPGTYTSPVNITTASLSATWAYDPTRNRFTLV